MTPPQGNAKRPARKAQPAKQALDYHREWLTKDEVQFHIEQAVRIDGDRREPRFQKIEEAHREIMIRLEDGFNRINTRLSMGDVDRKHQHEQGQSQNKALQEELAELKETQALQADQIADVGQLKGNLEVIVGLVKFVNAMHWFGELAKKKAFWTAIGMLIAGSSLATPLENLYFHFHPAARPVAVVKEVLTHQPTDTAPMPANQPALPSIPTTPITTYATPQQPNKEKVVGK